tara:strand:- start:953 stop:1237 length:285 start_codon:yes stop_codon:yes gene_type:complete
VEGWVAIAERFGLPFIMLLGMSWGGLQLFKWLANNLMKQIAENHTRIESIIVKLIDNSKQEREQNRQNMNEILSRMDQTISIMAKLTGNGLGKK